MNDMPNPIQIQKHLKGVDYPVGRQQLVDTAKREGASDDIIQALQNIEDRQYDAPTDVVKALTR